jgi:hypothetical protein
VEQMPLMNRDEHEALLNEMLNPEIEHSRRTEILQQLRVDHVTGHSDYEEVSKTANKLRSDNEDLIISNSKLFRQIGITGVTKKEKKKKKRKNLVKPLRLKRWRRESSKWLE